MKRKLVSHDAFLRIERDSLSTAARELSEAEGIVSNLVESPVELHAYDKNQVLYAMPDGSYLRADFEMKEGRIHFDNLEKLVIDEESYNENSRKIVNDMLESLYQNDETRATHYFGKYMECMESKMKFNKGRREKTATEKMTSNMKNMKYMKKEGFPKKKSKEADKAEQEVKQSKDLGKKKLKFCNCKEWLDLSNHILDHLNQKDVIPALRESKIERNDRGDIISITMPTANLRAEGKILDYKYKGLKSDVRVVREQALALGDNRNFQKAVAEVKRHNNLSDNDALEEALNKVVSNFPQVLYLTQNEMAQVVSTALENAGAANFDDQVCGFMADGILRTAYVSYPERANRLVSLANSTIPESANDPYSVFSRIVNEFYPHIDEIMAVEMQIYSDLHAAFHDVKRAAVESKHEAYHNDASRYLEKLESILNGETVPSLSLAEQAAWYLGILAETNLESKPWEVVKKPYTTLVGENPQMAKIAATGYTPSKDFTGDWGSAAPALDDNGTGYKSGKGAKEMESKSWTNKGGKDTYPSLSNPYVPKTDVRTVNSDNKIGDGNDADGQWSDSNTYPALQNPYVPKSLKRQVNSDNKVDDEDVDLGDRSNYPEF